MLVFLLSIGCNENAQVRQTVNPESNSTVTTLRLSQKDPLTKMLPPVFASDTNQITHTFSLRNDTSETVKIKRIIQSCSCTNADLSQKEIRPGESATFTMKVNVQNRVGPQIINARLVSDRDDSWLCELRTVIHRAVHFVPDNLSVGLVNRDEKKEILVTLELTGRSIDNIPTIEKLSAEGCEVSQLPPGVPEKLQLDAYKLNCPVRLLVLPSSQVGEHKSSLTASIRRNGQIETCTLPVQWLVRSSYKLTPSRAFFGKVGNEKVAETVTIKRINGENLRVKSVHADHPAIQCELVNDGDTKSTKIKIQLLAEKLEGPFWGEITVEADDSVEPKIKIPIAAIK